MTRTLLVAILLLASPSLACVGDCSADGEVTIAELISGVNLALGLTNGCTAFDRNDDGEVSIDELLAAVNNATGGCPLPATPTPTATPVPSPGETRCQVPVGEGVNYDPAQPFCELLSSYRFFTDGALQVPNDGVLPYDLNTPLFSDYARKHRFVWLPPGTAATYNARDSFTFPVGTVLIKTFAFPRDERDPLLGERLIETRLLARRAGGWEAITYLWNAEQTEAKRLVIGKRVAVSYPTEDGEFSINYQVPNTNQCKECHAEHNDVMGPLGPKARHLNKDHAYDDAVENQLTHWTAVGYLTGAPADPANAPRLPVFDDPNSGTVEERSRGYLDANCGHCHNPTGLARTSGLYLNIEEMEPARYGVCKPPVAAGQGSGGRRYDILPGDPDGSILVYRMESTAPGVAMPELGRQTVHAEAVALMREWISAMEGSCE
ncbi:MAG: SO2930 family diheme c-type cytochrome [Deltaproteobacteria bacterium]|nr:SO2930 family diheme c-type cytochrome [Deltaproteobacteria bacterium]